MCNHMFSIQNPKTGERILVPCGHCISCLTDMQSEWATRMTMELESNLSRPAVFVTLTYNDENLPVNEVNEETGEIFQKPCVKKSDVQQFIRSLRTKVKRYQNRGVWKGYKGPLKYFFTSEYGPEGGRPHYHGIIYGLTKKDLNLIEEVWNKGFVYVGDANEKTIVYCSKYCVKPTELQSNPNRAGYFDNERWMEDNGIRRKPFRLMSTKLGASYVEDSQNLRFHFKQLFSHNYIRVGKCKKKMPRYFKKKIYTEENMEKYGDRKQLIKLINKAHKNDSNYGLPYYYYDVTNIIGRSQYYRHLAESQQKWKISEADAYGVIQDSQQKERLLAKSREKWMRRAGRYHIQ